MTVSIATLKLACELAGVWMVGMVAILVFVVSTVDRLNARIAELEERLEGAGVAGAATTSRGGRKDSARPSRASVAR